MEIEKASEMGFCFGVRRAIELVESASREKGSLQTLGPLVHNKQVVHNLAQVGINAVSNLEEVKGHIVAIPSHGVSPEVIKQIKARGLEVIDATCPYVRKLQIAAQKLGKDDLYVLVFGDASHPEVKAVLGWAGEKASSALEIPNLTNLPKRIGIVCQTTQNQSRFADFVAGIISSEASRYSELRIMNTICDATRKRQSAVLELVKSTDLIIVIGGRDSSNTRRLAEICEAAGAVTYHIENEGEINPSWLRGKRRIGVTAGASTPDDIIDQVVAKLKKYNMNK
ncbi:MAG: 4-hydroxy-3-methylbut-2-enyl diphosphate reductase [Chloroflexi bacterium]|nr:4-hydroxy-3-methylbut-2-enyl diphosphate reductase [Chloroflexota bacterium]